MGFFIWRRPIFSQASSGWEQLELPQLTTSQDGYVQVFVANESDTDVWFDEVEVRHTPGLVAQENHYSPWGLNLAGIERQGQPDHKFQFNGKEKQEELGLNWIDYGARMYDAQLGRWHAVDPLAERNPDKTPYHFVSNDPINRIDPDGLDDYRVNKEGYITLKRKTESENDKLIARSGFLGLNKKTLEVDKGVLSNIKSGEEEINGEKVKYDFMSVMGEEKGQTLFEFLAKNTEVEWTLMKFGEGGMQSNTLSTTHKSDVEVGATDLLLNNPFGRASDFRGLVHNHPNGEWRPSGSVHMPGHPNRVGDVAFAKRLQQIHKGKSLNFRIYTPNNGKYIPYDGDTYIPMVLPEVEVIIKGKK